MRTTRAKANAVAVTETVPSPAKLTATVQSPSKLREKCRQVEIIDCYGVAKWVYKDGVKVRGRGTEVRDLSESQQAEGIPPAPSALANGSRVKEEQNGTHVDVEQDGIHVKEEGNGTIPKEQGNGTIFINGQNGICVNEQADLAQETVLISEKMAEEEQLLEEQRLKDLAASEEAVGSQTAVLEDSLYQKLDTLLSKTQLYSEFLLEKMDKIALVTEEPEEPVKKGRGGGRGVKRKAAAASPRLSTRSTTDSCPVLADLQEDSNVDGLDDEFLTEEELVAKEQKKIIPLLTGGTLKPFQLKGIKWMISLWQNGLNGILADQMGLGKTIQAIGLLAHLKGRDMHGPFLVCAPLSTLSNWVSEIQKWVPVLPVVLYHGSKEERAVMRRKLPDSSSPDFPVIVTSYEVAMFDRTHLARRKWKYIIVDEGHRLKNFDCKLLRELRKVPVDNKLLLTGTPLQNNLGELWSLLNFILPQIFSSLEQFESWFDFSGKQSNGLNKEEIDEQRRLEVVTQLHGILRPFLLRRLKQDVMKNIPPKKEIILYAELADAQKGYQDLLLSRALNEHFDAQKLPGASFKTRLNNVVMQLRKNANHPDLLESHFSDNIDYPPVQVLLEQCGKLRLLDRLLKHLRAHGHKVLIFSQMTSMLDILEYYLQENGLDPCRIDGNVKLKDRQEEIRQFNSDSYNRYVFILSTRAGGLGINLTAADTVIIYDSDWNPQMDLQAMDRCHRIGQAKPVHVYRLLTSQTVECRMIKVANRKMHLERVVIEKGHFKQEANTPKQKLEESDIMFLLRQDRDEEEEYVQSSEISDADLLVALDRTDLMLGMEGHEAKPNPGPVLPLKGPGWEVVVKLDSSNNILSSIEGYRKFPTEVVKTESEGLETMESGDLARQDSVNVVKMKSEDVEMVESGGA
ncbi:unnamed protein product [Calypogeia fissa]